MAKMTGAEALLNQIMTNGVDTIFGLPGGQLDHFFDAMYKQGDDLRFYCTRHDGLLRPASRRAHPPPV